MTNKEMINKLKDMAELAIVAYGYFHLANPKYDFNQDNTDKKRLEHFRELKAKELGRDLDENTYPTPTDILNIEYKYFKDENGKPQDSWYHKHFLGGDMSPTQAKNFLKKYDVLIHQPNTHSGFSATLFSDKTKNRFIVGFRGTECRF